MKEYSKQPEICSNPTSQTYTVKEVAKILNISIRTAYYFCETTKEFKVFRLGRTIRIHKASFDLWFSGR